MSNALITFVNHASVIFSHKDIRLMTDPWLFGSAFNNGWELLSKSKFQLNDFAKITHIWFSHEHPDHFQPALLSKIPENVRRNITILFQDTLDHRVAKKCKQLKFKEVIEMKINSFYTLSDNFKILVTTTTLSAAIYAKQKFGKKIIHQYAPLDIKIWIERFINNWKPDLSIWIESDLWPVTLKTLKEKSIKSILLNLRISPKSFEKWLLFKI